MFKGIEIFCSHNSLGRFAPYGWTNVRQGHLTCVGFTVRAF